MSVSPWEPAAAASQSIATTPTAAGRIGAPPVVDQAARSSDADRRPRRCGTLANGGQSVSSPRNRARCGDVPAVDYSGGIALRDPILGDADGVPAIPVADAAAINRARPRDAGKIDLAARLPGGRTTRVVYRLPQSLGQR